MARVGDWKLKRHVVMIWAGTVEILRTRCVLCPPFVAVNCFWWHFDVLFECALWLRWCVTAIRMVEYDIFFGLKWQKGALEWCILTMCEERVGEDIRTVILRFVMCGGDGVWQLFQLFLYWYIEVKFNASCDAVVWKYVDSQLWSSPSWIMPIRESVKIWPQLWDLSFGVFLLRIDEWLSRPLQPFLVFYECALLSWHVGSWSIILQCLWGVEYKNLIDGYWWGGDVILGICYFSVSFSSVAGHGKVYADIFCFVFFVNTLWKVGKSFVTMPSLSKRSRLLKATCNI